jgi:hypothetical protein
MAQDIIITPADATIDFFNTVGGAVQNAISLNTGDSNLEVSSIFRAKSNIYIDQNLGIGTVTPSGQIHVYDGAAGNEEIVDQIILETYRTDFGTGPGGNSILFKNQDSNNATNIGRIKAVTVNDTDFGDNDESATNFVFSMTDGGIESDKFILTARGNVGINVMNPTSTLHVAGDAKIDTVATNNSATEYLVLGAGNLIQKRTGGTQGAQGVQGVQGVQGIQGLRGYQGFQGNQGAVGSTGNQGAQGVQGVQGDSFWTRSGNDVYLSDTNDIVGIGNTNPTYGLDVSGTIGGVGEFHLHPNQDASLFLGKYNESAGNYDGSYIHMHVGALTGTFTKEFNVYANNFTPANREALFGIQRINSSGTYGGEIINYTDSSGWEFRVTSNSSSTSSTPILYIKNDGNVGISDSTPSYKLDIAGTLRSTSSSYFATSGGSVGIGTTSASAALHINSSDPNDVIRMYNTDTSQYYSFRFDSLGNLLIDHDNGITNTYPFKLKSGSLSDLLVLSGSNVGIGTQTPSAKLEVAGTVKISNQLTSTLAIGTSPFSITSTTVNTNLNSDLLDGQHGSYYLSASSVSGTSNYIPKFTSASTIGNSVLFEYLGARIGIGTTAPSRTLHVVSSDPDPIQAYRNGVNCSIHLQNNVDDVYFGVNASGNAAIGHSADLSSANFQITSAGKIGIGTLNPTSEFDMVDEGHGTYGSIRVSNATGDFTALDPRYGLILSRGASYIDNIFTGGDIHFRVSESGPRDLTAVSILDNGRVGMGTTVPSVNLHIKSTGDAAIILEADSASGIEENNAYIKFSQDAGAIIGGIGFMADAGTGPFSSVTNGLQNGLVIQHETGSVQLATNGTANFTLDSSGNVGISDSTPSYKLDIAGTLRSTSASYFATSSGSIGIGTTAPDAIVRIDDNAGTGTGLKITGGGGGGSLLTLERDVGTTGKSIIFNASNSKPQMVFTFNADQFTLGMDGDAFKIIDGGTLDAVNQRFMIATNGDIAIGPTGPDTNLLVYADTDSTNGTIKAMDLSAGNYTSLDPAQGLIFNRSTSYINNRNTGGDLRFRMSSTGPTDITAMTVLSNGNVGIGTVTPAYVLDVNGSVHATSFPTSSDRRFKKNITPITNAINTIKALNGVSFNWNEFINERRKGYSLNERILGFIAQDVEKIIPEVVQNWNLSEDVQDARSLDYVRIIPVIVEAIKEQQIQIEELTKLLNEK